MYPCINGLSHELRGAKIQAIHARGKSEAIGETTVLMD